MEQDDGYLRQPLVVGALAVAHYAERHETRRPLLVQVLAKRPAKVATVAVADKIARIVWAMMSSGKSNREPMPAAVWIRCWGVDKLGKGTDGLTHLAGRYRRTGKPSCATAPPSVRNLSGRVLAEGIMAGGLMCRTKRLSTWPHPPRCRSPINPCQRRTVHTWRRTAATQLKQLNHSVDRWGP